MAEKDVLVAYVLWFFLGVLGIHRFYLNRPISGIIWLLTGGLFGIGWLIDLCLIPGMVEEENLRYQQFANYPTATVISTTYQQPTGIYPSQPQSTYYQ